MGFVFVWVVFTVGGFLGSQLSRLIIRNILE